MSAAINANPWCDIHWDVPCVLCLLNGIIITCQYGIGLFSLSTETNKYTQCMCTGFMFSRGIVAVRFIHIIQGPDSI